MATFEPDAIREWIWTVTNGRAVIQIPQNMTPDDIDGFLDFVEIMKRQLLREKVKLSAIGKVSSSIAANFPPNHDKFLQK